MTKYFYMLRHGFKHLIDRHTRFDKQPFYKHLELRGPKLDQENERFVEISGHLKILTDLYSVRTDSPYRSQEYLNGTLFTAIGFNLPVTGIS